MKPWILLVALAMVAGCGQPPSTPQSSRLALNHLSQPTEACMGTGLAAVVRGSASDPEVAWVESFGGGDRSDVDWPAGYAARFAPGLEILDASGRVVLRDGDFIDGTCGSDSGGRIRLAPPFLALRLECGPMSLWTCPSLARRAADAAGWPGRDIASIEFTSPDGQYRLTFEDGSSVTGSE